MFVKPTQKFASQVTKATIKVTKVVRSTSGDNRYDVCRVLNVQANGIADRSNPRYIYADSIRRRYFQVK